MVEYRRLLPVLCAGFILQPLCCAQARRPNEAFADLFASVLKTENPDGGDWQSPDKYLESAKSTASVPLRKNINDYRLLIVPGFLSACTAAPTLPTAAYAQARQHLRYRHGIDAALLQVPDDSSEDNGRLIAGYLRSHANDRRKFIVLGHSKGAADLQLALQDPVAAATVAALVSVAGAVRGSPLADTLSGIDLVGKLTQSFGCAGRLGPSLQSLRTDTRIAFAQAHPNPPVPSYSIVAASDFTNTSRALLASWSLLGAGFRPEDGLLIAGEGKLPGAKLLGTAIADHVAVAHDFRDTSLSALFNKNDFPRAALLEAIVRFIVEDLDSPRSRP